MPRSLARKTKPAMLQYPDAPLWDDMTAAQRQEMTRALVERYQRLLERAAELRTTTAAQDPAPGYATTPA